MISTKISHGITIGNSGSYTYPSPLTITSAGGVSNNGTGDAVFSSIANPALYNQGTINATGNHYGVYFRSGGSVANVGATALIEGELGVDIRNAAGAVTNSGVIDGIGETGVGVYIYAAGSVGNTGLIEAGANLAAVFIYDAGTVTNSGTIVGTFGSGIFLNAGGTVTNTAGTISGKTQGVLIEHATGLVTNTGTISGTGGQTYLSVGVEFRDGGSVANNAGSIGGYRGVYITGAAGTVTNAGTIQSTSSQGSHHGGFGVLLNSGGSVDNLSSGLIAGYYAGIDFAARGTLTNAGTIEGTATAAPFTVDGVYFAAGGTVIDSGRISGPTGTAIDFAGAGGNLLALEHGYSLGGGVSVAGASNTLELLGSAGAVTVAFDKVGAGFTNFGTVAFGAASGNNETLAISNTTGTVGTFASFTSLHDIVDLSAVAGGTIVGGGTVNGSDQLVISNGINTVTLQLDSENYTGLTWAAQSDGGGGTDVMAATCFCRGTLILTEAGEVAVEDLAIGDKVVTLSGDAKPVRWIGRRGYDGRFVAGNRAVLPIRVMAGALSDGVPARELWVSPEHALYLDGALVPAGLLVNGASIVQIEDIDQVEYFHIELAAHDVLFAEGAPAESFVDDDSRGVFHNVAEFYALYPEAPVREPASYCAPRLEEGFALEALRRRLLGRARRLGADGKAQPGVLRGLLERVHRARISGWAFDPASPDTPVALVVLANGAEIGRVVAELYRSDLADAGIGDGYHAFELIVPGGLTAGMRHEIEVRHAADWSLLPGSPWVWEPAAAAPDRQQPHPPSAALPPLGALRGTLDACDRTRISGWTQDSADPERRVGLVITVNDRVIGRMLANSYRGDLETAGIGDGRHAFELTIPGGLSGLQAWEIRVEREADGAELPGSPITLPAANEFDAGIEEDFAGILANAAAGAAEDRALAFLTRQTDRLLTRRAERHGGPAEREAHRLFRRRWGPQGENGSEPFRPPHLRALVVDLQVPCATRDAGSVAILSHVRALRGLGYEVSFAASDDMGNATALARLAAAEEIATCGLPHYSCVEDLLCRQAGSFDLVYLHRAANADRYLPLVRRYCPKARILYSVGDLHHVRLARQAQVERRPELLAHSRYLAALEMMAARRADIVITHSPVEAELLRREVGFGKVHVVPFAVASRQPRRPFSERHGMAILGSFAHAPNPDAVHYLASDILPRVWARDPGLTCKIVGHGWHAGRLPGLDPRIEMIGEVEDLDEVFDTVRLTVAPLRFGAGIKGKVLDSFAACLPCVMTPIAAEGLALTGSLPQLVADNPAELAELILHHHADSAANEQTGMDGARMVASEFCAERVSDALRKILSNSVSAADNPSRDTPRVASAA